MVKPVNPTLNTAPNSNPHLTFEPSPNKINEKYDKDTLLKNNFSTNMRIALDKLTNAATVYPAKGLTGNKNSNFYEFLTMGTVPYIIGSLTLMSVFNSANKYFEPFAKSKASKIGNKMALGVLFYGIAKELSKPLITAPVKMATGVDVNLPYARVIYELPDYKDDTDITSIEYHKIFESVEFPRWDLLYGDESKGKARNAYFDKVAKKLGLGENLKDSDQEVKPRIKEIVTKTAAVKNIVPYLWAGLGVAVAMQEPWDDFFTRFSNAFKFYKYSEFIEHEGQQWTFGAKLGGTVNNMAKEAGQMVKSFGRIFRSSVKELYCGSKNTSKANRIAGKLMIAIPVIATVLGDLKIISGNKKTITKEIKNADPAVISPVIQQDRKYVVN